MDTNAKLYQDLDCVLLTRDQIAARIKEMGAKITRDFEGKPLLCICVLKGSVVFFSDLMREIELPLEIDFISLSSYGAGTESSGIITERSSLTRDITGRHLLIVEDIVDTGRTLQFLKNLLGTRQPASLKICTLLDKPSRRLVDMEADYVGFEVPDEFVVGYGLDFDDAWRQLPYIGVLKPEAYGK